MTSFRPFHIASRTQKATENTIDDVLVGTVAGQTAEYIRTDDTVLYAVQSSINDDFSEFESLVKTKIRKLLQSAHETSPATTKDFSSDPNVVAQIAQEACEMAQNLQTVSASPLTDDIPAYDDGAGMILDDNGKPLDLGLN